MSELHFYDAGAYIDHEDAKSLFPVTDLWGQVHTHRDAEVVLGDVAPESVVVVKPTGLASSYALTQRALCAVEIASLDQKTLDKLKAASGIDLTEFELVQIGRQTKASQNRSLGEFRDGESSIKGSVGGDRVR